MIGPRSHMRQWQNETWDPGLLNFLLSILLAHLFSLSVPLPANTASGWNHSFKSSSLHVHLSIICLSLLSQAHLGPSSLT